MIIDHFCREKERDKKRDAAWTGWEWMGVKETFAKKTFYYNTFRTFFKFKFCFYRMSNIIFIRSVHIDS